MIDLTSGGSSSAGGEQTQMEIEKVAESVFTAATSGNIITLDGTLSTYDGEVKGGVSGDHRLSISTSREYLNLQAQGEPLTLVAGSGVTEGGDGFVKDAGSNGWAAWFSSQESFNPLLSDFAVTWLVESITSPINEMVGLDDNPSANASYSSIEYALYQVNNYIHSNVYEKGLATPTGSGNVYLKIGDRMGVRCESGVVTYFVISDGVVTDIYESAKRLEKTVYLKAALNRAGTSRVGGCESITATVSKPIVRTISGSSTAEVSEADAEKLKEIGLTVASGAQYSKVIAEKTINDRFPSGRSYEAVHGYYVISAQSMATV